MASPYETVSVLKKLREQNWNAETVALKLSQLELMIVQNDNYFEELKLFTRRYLSTRNNLRLSLFRFISRINLSVQGMYRINDIRRELVEIECSLHGIVSNNTWGQGKLAETCMKDAKKKKKFYDKIIFDGASKLRNDVKDFEAMKSRLPKMENNLRLAFTKLANFKRERLMFIAIRKALLERKEALEAGK